MILFRFERTRIIFIFPSKYIFNKVMGTKMLKFLDIVNWNIPLSLFLFETKMSVTSVQLAHLKWRIIILTSIGVFLELNVRKLVKKWVNATPQGIVASSQGFLHRELTLPSSFTKRFTFTLEKLSFPLKLLILVDLKEVPWFSVRFTLTLQVIFFWGTFFFHSMVSLGWSFGPAVESSNSISQFFSDQLYPALDNWSQSQRSKPWVQKQAKRQIVQLWLWHFCSK